jgi:TfoX/Sxy family transcriptional regulator of competence genes
MPYDLDLARRIRARMEGLPALEEKKMFGGVGFLLHGNMACGVHKNSMIVRVAPQKHMDLLTLPHTRPFDMTGRPMSGWLVVDPDGCRSEEQLAGWVKEGVEFALSLPSKEK